MDIQLSIVGRRDLAGQIYRQLCARILDGRLPAGERLPSTRDLAAQLGVSRKTTLDVFERLSAEGYLSTRPGDGSFVAAGLARPAAETAPPDTLIAVAPFWAGLPAALAMPRSASRLALDFRGGVTDKDSFPNAAWRRCINQALRAQARQRGAYRDLAGEQELRLAVARYLGYSRALNSSWQEVIMTQGAQQALDLLARVLLRPGDVVAVEDPGYPPARACFAAQGAAIAAVPVDAQGLCVDRLPDDARLVYVTPSHQFPLGMPMSLERRLELLAWARQRGALIIEDDYDGEFRFTGRPLDSLKSLDRAGVVAYVGTFSKTMFPELRVGYVVPPASLAAALGKAKQLGDWHGCTLTQSALASFMLDGDFAKHLRRMHKRYALRRQALLAGLNDQLGAWLRPLPSAAGIHLAVRLQVPCSEERLIAAAGEAGIGLYGLRGFYVEAVPQPGLLFGYGGIAVEDIEQALQVLRALLPTLTS